MLEVSGNGRDLFPRAIKHLRGGDRRDSASLRFDGTVAQTKGPCGAVARANESGALILGPAELEIAPAIPPGQLALKFHTEYPGPIHPRLGLLGSDPLEMWTPLSPSTVVAVAVRSGEPPSILARSSLWTKGAAAAADFYRAPDRFRTDGVDTVAVGTAGTASRRRQRLSQGRRRATGSGRVQGFADRRLNTVQTRRILWISTARDVYLEGWHRERRHQPRIYSPEIWSGSAANATCRSGILRPHPAPGRRSSARSSSEMRILRCRRSRISPVVWAWTWPHCLRRRMVVDARSRS
jgi:hypothetical protein